MAFGTDFKGGGGGYINPIAVSPRRDYRARGSFSEGGLLGSLGDLTSGIKDIYSLFTMGDEAEQNKIQFEDKRRKEIVDVISGIDSRDKSFWGEGEEYAGLGEVLRSRGIPETEWESYRQIGQKKWNDARYKAETIKDSQDLSGAYEDGITEDAAGEAPGEITTNEYPAEVPPEDEQRLGYPQEPTEGPQQMPAPLDSDLAGVPEVEKMSGGGFDVAQFAQQWQEEAELQEFVNSKPSTNVTITTPLADTIKNGIPNLTPNKQRLYDLNEQYAHAFMKVHNFTPEQLHKARLHNQQMLGLAFNAPQTPEQMMQQVRNFSDSENNLREITEARLQEEYNILPQWAHIYDLHEASANSALLFSLDSNGALREDFIKNNGHEAIDNLRAKVESYPLEMRNNKLFRELMEGRAGFYNQHGMAGLSYFMQKKNQEIAERESNSRIRQSDASISQENERIKLEARRVGMLENRSEAEISQIVANTREITERTRTNLAKVNLEIGSKAMETTLSLYQHAMDPIFQQSKLMQELQIMRNNTKNPGLDAALEVLNQRSAVRQQQMKVAQTLEHKLFTKEEREYFASVAASATITADMDNPMMASIAEKMKAMPDGKQMMEELSKVMAADRVADELEEKVLATLRNQSMVITLPNGQKTEVFIDNGDDLMSFRQKLVEKLPNVDKAQNDLWDRMLFIQDMYFGPGAGIESQAYISPAANKFLQNLVTHPEGLNVAEDDLLRAIKSTPELANDAPVDIISRYNRIKASVSARRKGTSTSHGF